MHAKKHIFVIQFRTDETIEQDQRCIEKALEGMEVELKFFNAPKGEFPENPENAAAVIYSGSSEFYVERGAETDSWVPKTHEYLDELAEKNIPVFGICYGSQFIGKHYGGRITEDENLQELGAFEITLTEEGKKDEVFSQIPEKFLGIIGHKETLVDLPDNLIVLASTEKVESQALRVKGKPIWSVLYHPEVNRDQLIERMVAHPEYLEDPSKLEEYKAEWPEVPHYADALQAFARFAIADFDKRNSAE